MTIKLHYERKNGRLRISESREFNTDIPNIAFEMLKQQSIEEGFAIIPGTVYQLLEDDFI